MECHLQLLGAYFHLCFELVFHALYGPIGEHQGPLLALLEQVVDMLAERPHYTRVADARPAVFHCTAGKDRTGLLSALVLSLLGVPEDTVVTDYALSGAAMQRLRAKLVVKYPDGKLLVDTDAIFSAEPSNMVALFAHLKERYRTVEQYATSIGVPDGVVTALRQAMLEPAA